jgi:hypothetical protein
MSVEKSYHDGEKEDRGDGVKTQTLDIFTDDSLDPVYKAKARILNDALQEIGMGKYQVSNPHTALVPLLTRFEVVLVRGSWFWLAVVS